MDDPIDTVERFNTCINRRDLDQLAQLLHTDYVFIDSAGTKSTERDRE